MKVAGAPRKVRKAYEEFQGRLVVHNQAASDLGESYAKPTSIPQGDPFSMMVTSLLMRAWTMQVKSTAVQPRVLADDLQLLCTGPKHLKLVENGSTKTHEHLGGYRSENSATQVDVFSTDEATRNCLRSHKWRRLGKVVEVVTDCMDLGAHLNATTRRWYGKALTNRMLQVADETGRLKQGESTIR